MKYDAIIIGGGHAGMSKAVELQKQGLNCLVINKGVSLYGFDPDEFESLGGTVLKSDEVVSATIQGDEVKSVFTANLEATALEAERFFLATGKFFAGGLKSDMDGIYEPLFGLDVEYDKDSSRWFADKFSDDQPFMHFHVKTDACGNALKDGKSIKNLFPIGDITAE